MVSDEEILRWAKEKYPEYADNLKLMRILYEREHNRGRRENREIEYKKKKVADINVGEFVELDLLVADFARSLRYKGCPKCRRKNCDCGFDKVTYRRDAYWCGDETGVIKIYLPWEREDNSEYEYLDIGRKIRVHGRVDEFNGKKNIDVKEWWYIDEEEEAENEDEEIKKIVDELRPTKKMLKDIFERFIERKYGLTIKDFVGYVKIEKDNEGEWVVFE